MNLTNLILFLLFANTVLSAKILFFTVIPTHSHQKVYRQVWNELASKGHEVHAVTPNPSSSATSSNLVEYDLSSLYKLQEDVVSQADMETFYKKPSFFGMIVRQIVYKTFGGLGMETIFNHEEVKRLMKIHQNFDVCIIEWIHPTAAAFGYHFKCPMIGISSVGLQIPLLETVGNPNHPIIAPDLDLPFPKELETFFQRVWSVTWSVFVRIYNSFSILPDEDRRIKKYFGQDVPYLGDILKNVSLIILNRNLVFHRPVPNVPVVIEIGGFKQTHPVEKVLPDLRGLMDNSKNGVIYFSLGSSMQGIFLSKKYVKLMQDTFESLPYDFLWKWENDTMPNKPKNVFLGKWIPQIAVLEHPNVKLFITQGGLQSTEEAIAAHKPIIGIPFHSDQTTNVDTCVKYGMGKMLDLEDITVEKLRSYILEIVNNPSYAENAKKLDELMKDQPQDGLEKAVWWIEYVIRHKGARHLRSIAVDLPWWQYLMLDVIGFILVVLLSVIFVLYFTLKLSLRLLLRLIKRGRKQKRKAE